MDKEQMIPFGFQYYRYPTPFRMEWEKDLRKIAELGFNSVKYWVQWRVNHPRHNEFWFDDIHELMDLAHCFGLKVVLNVIFDVTPTWFYKDHPDAKMIAANGSVLEPVALSYRQVGGAPGPCYHHEEAKRQKALFLAETVRRFKDHPALLLWDLWNEPELTTGIKRPLSFDNQVCYCDSSMSAFRQWLTAKYGSLEQLNEKWQRNYNSWEEVEAPRGQAVYNDMIDWRLFHVDTLASEIHERVQIVKTLDLDHPAMCHTVPFPIFNAITAGTDDFRLAEPCDWFGNSLGSSAWSADLLISAAKGKKIINSEIHALPGHTALKPKKPEWTEVKKHIFVPLARGITGFLFWQYRPETLGHESPAWGSTYLDGSETPWLRQSAELNNLVQEHRELLVRGTRPSDKIAILYSTEGQIANFAAYGHLATFEQSLLGAHQLLHDLNYKVEFLHEQDVDRTHLQEYRALWLPYPLYLNGRMCEELRTWVEGGGILLSECSFGALQAEKGTHSQVVPGYGFDAVFGIRETWIHSVERLDHSYHQVTLQHSEPVPLRWNGQASLSGAFYRTEVTTAPGVEVLSEFAGGGAAVTSHDYGSGKAIWIGTLLAAAYQTGLSDKTREFMKDLLQEKLGIAPLVDAASANVRVDILLGDKDAAANGKALLFVENRSEDLTRAVLRLPRKAAVCRPWFADGKAEITGEGLELDLPPSDIQVFTVTFQ